MFVLSPPAPPLPLDAEEASRPSWLLCESPLRLFRLPVLLPKLRAHRLRPARGFELGVRGVAVDDAAEAGALGSGRYSDMACWWWRLAAWPMVLALPGLADEEVEDAVEASLAWWERVWGFRLSKLFDGDERGG